MLKKIAIGILAAFIAMALVDVAILVTALNC